MNRSFSNAPQKTVAIVQARMGSTRFPNKMMKLINGTPMIGLLIKRLSASRKIDEIVLATSVAPENNPMADYVAGLGHTVYRGSEDDVLSRYYESAKLACADTVVRITGDCPLVDAQVVDEVIEAFEKANVDFVSNAFPPTYPDGLDLEVFSFRSLESAANEATQLAEREHVDIYIVESGKFTTRNVQCAEDYSAHRWTVDEPEDLEVIRGVFAHFFPKTDFRWTEVLALWRKQPELFSANRHLIRNEGAAESGGTPVAAD